MQKSPIFRGHTTFSAACQGPDGPRSTAGRILAKPQGRQDASARETGAPQSARGLAPNGPEIPSVATVPQPPVSQTPVSQTPASQTPESTSRLHAGPGQCAVRQSQSVGLMALKDEKSSRNGMLDRASGCVSRRRRARQRAGARPIMRDRNPLVQGSAPLKATLCAAGPRSRVRQTRPAAGILLFTNIPGGRRRRGAEPPSPGRPYSRCLRRRDGPGVRLPL